MALDDQIKTRVHKYISVHVGDECWHNRYFDFIDDITLRKRLGEEFISTRYIYKLLEGLGAENWLLRAQIRLQIIFFASIYEAVIHHLIFTTFMDSPQVIELRKFPTKKEISIPAHKLAVLSKHLGHNGKK
jgi:hypothetical protein